MATLLEAAQILQDLDFICFSAQVTYALNSKNELKKSFKGLPKQWQQFTLDTPLNERVHLKHNALFVVTGPASGFIAIDIDDVPQFKQYLVDIGQSMESVFNTWSQSTGSGGKHLLFEWEPRFDLIKTNAKSIVHPHTGVPLNVDIRSKQGCIIVDPTKTIAGTIAGTEIKEYKWINRPGGPVGLAKMPEWLFQVLVSQNKGKGKAVVRPSAVASSSGTSSPSASGVSEQLSSFILDTFGVLPQKLQSIKYYEDSKTWIIQTVETQCVFAKKNHTSNHQYFVIRESNRMIVRKCHDGDSVCKEREHKPTRIPDDVWAELTQGVPEEIVVPATATIEPVEVNDDLIKQACEEGEEHIKDNHQQIVQLNRDTDTKVLTGGPIKDILCPNSKCGRPMNVYAKIGPEGSVLVCNYCSAPFPFKAQPIDPTKHRGLGAYLSASFNLHLTQNITQNNYQIHQYGVGTVDIGWNEFINDSVAVVPDPVLNQKILKALSGEDLPLAELLHALFGDVTVHSRDGGWFEFKDHRWKKDDDIIALRQLRNDKFIDLILKAKTAYENASSVSNKEKKVAQIQKVLSNVLKTSTQNSVVSQYEISCRKSLDEWFNKLNSNKHLIGFTNGVYDLQTFEFRAGRPDDLITMTVGYDYDETKMNDPLKLKGFNDYMAQTFPHEDLVRYVLKFLGSCLAGYTKDQLFHFGYGSGSNGKGVLLTAIAECLGDYAGKLDSAFLTGKTPGANDATPALNNIVGKRFVAISETARDAKLNEPLFKAVCGEDELVYRPMYGECRQFKPDFNFWLMCNDLPEFSGDDYAMERRIRVVPFLSTFKKPGQSIDPEKNEYPINEGLLEESKTWKYVIMKVLIDSFKLYVREGLAPPASVIKATEKYRKRNNPFEIARDELLVKAPISSGVGIDAYVDALLHWAKTNAPELIQKSQKRNKFYEAIDLSLAGCVIEAKDRRFGSAREKGWKGWSLK